MSEKTISLGTYLFKRLHSEPIGIKNIFGVPGDFNLELLDKIEEIDGLNWVGSVNELNAGYSADGYARGSLAALITTFGVGELSAVNAVAGAYSEHIPIVHIVGTPSTESTKKQLLLHHTLGNGDFDVFHKISSFISATTAVLDDPATATDEIDRVIETAYINQRPTYLGFPSNMFHLQVPASKLDKPLNLTPPPNDPKVQSEVLDDILSLIQNAKDPVIIIDACCARHDSTPEAKKLIELTSFKFAVTPMAKGSRDIDESSSRFIGTYVGDLSYPRTKDLVESSDLVLSLGAVLSDYNTGSFSYSLDNAKVVEFHSDYTKIKSAHYPGIRMKELLGKLVGEGSALTKICSHITPQKLVLDKFEPVVLPSDHIITQSWLWSNLGGWLREGDVIITETGTSSFGIVQTKFPKNAVGISQVLWGSIGYSVGSAAGAVIAAEEVDPSRRVILFVGDGSLQLTVQEISTMARHKNNIYIFVLNNEGFTIERLIHGPKAVYNDIHSWENTDLLKTFKADNYETYSLKTIGDITKVFKDEKFAKNDKIRLIEIKLDVLDGPENLIEQGRRSEASNK
ncbi:PDC11 Pyruvate decarboxylase [Candida maltosa Xu316]